ncbi:MAG: beta-galactosidase [Prevotellaceae bacterium]|jgi:beta-galactosidase|nr:beta-galactosidase [Prevotellaceae bacterium]
MKRLLLWLSIFLMAQTIAQAQLSFGNKTLMLNGKPFVIKAAELHYPRIPSGYWEHRIEMCKALGMNTICLYVFWNLHEPEEGNFDFSGNNDVAAFCKLAQKHGMYVILRPGPYVCAEWEMGGLPWWLLKKKDIQLRKQDPYFMERVRLFMAEVGKQLKDLQLDNGGNILMVQVENEYGSYGEDKPYISEIRDIVKASGFDKAPLFQCDWSSNFENNALDSLFWTLNFGTGANIDEQFKRLQELRPETPLMCSEFWSGWFDKWGARHETRSAKEMVDGLREMVRKNISFSLYMAHGGTSFGHWAGANSPGFAPDVTSYDYDAPINEAGQATPKYYELRAMLQEFLPKGEKLPAVPKAIPTTTFPKVQATHVAPLFENLPEAHTTHGIQTMETFNQGWGAILYSAALPEIKSQGKLTLTEAHDFAQVFVDGKFVGKLDRRLGEKDLLLPPIPKGARLDILVEAMGRINFGQAIKDFKGITEKVELTMSIGEQEFTANLKNWSAYLFPASYEFSAAQKYAPLGSGSKATIGYYKGSFNVKKVGDTFLDMQHWGKGMVWVNGHALGRFWNIGPQQTLYLPGLWLKKGENEIIVLDVVGTNLPVVEGLATPLYDQLPNAQPVLHRVEGQQINLSSEKPFFTAAFAAGNGWQETKFDSAVNGRYLCIEALNGQAASEIAAIAELYLLDENGQRIPREGWRIPYADSEDVAKSNRAADKSFDLQESTYWSTVKDVPYPHHLVIDLGRSYTLSAIQYLPRMESGAPGSIKDFQLYIGRIDFRYY